MDGFLPVSKKDMDAAGIGQLDFVFVTGDAYVDHPSFAHTLISRYLAAHGHSVGIIAQPNWKDPLSVKKLGRPRLGFLVGAGNMDSMVNLFTVEKKRRRRDLYSPGGKAGKRPPRATQVYTKLIRAAYGDVPVVIGGIEASLRRFAHYDYWENKVLPSVLASSGADLLVYGMGERAIVQIAEALDGGLPVGDITYIEGTAYMAPDLSRVYDYVELPGENKVNGEKRAYVEAFRIESKDREHVLVQRHKSGYVVQNPPAAPLSGEEMDFAYSLPYTRSAHPTYAQPVPALDEVKYSITATRGCVGECAFCALAYHQGKHITSRGRESVISEAKEMTRDPQFKGYIHDVGGPTANLYGARCANPKGPCTARRCLTPKPCRHFREGQGDYTALLKELRRLPGVKKVFVRSGVRHDVALLDKSGQFISELARHHVSGQLKLAPEHVADHVLDCMGKPHIEEYERFCAKFNNASQKAGKKQFVLPYFLSSHPGSTLDDAVKLAEYIRDSGFAPEQAQDFYPTPGTAATCMYYTGVDPRTGKQVFVEKRPEGKAMQRALAGYRDPRNYATVKRALKLAGREDLAGRGKRCLING